MTANPDRGLDYLRAAFPNPDISFENDFLSPDFLEGFISKSAQRIDEKFDFDPEDWPVVTEQEKYSIKQRADSGTDTLAWYCPYSSYGSKWGIYFDVETIDGFAKHIHRQLLAKGAILHFGQTLKMVYDALTRHEVEHFNVEMAAARMISRGAAPSHSYQDMRKFPDFKRLSEVNATQMEFFQRPSVKILDSLNQNLYYHTWMQQPLPSPYDEWDSLDLSYNSVFLELAFGTVGFSQELNDVRTLSGLSGSNRFIRVPKYYWYSSRFGGDASDSSCKIRLDCKSTISWVIKSQKYFSDLGITVTHGNDHDIKVSGTHQSMPIKLSCHDWNQIPPHVVSQLSSLYKLKKLALMEAIRKGK